MCIFSKKVDAVLFVYSCRWLYFHINEIEVLENQWSFLTALCINTGLVKIVKSLEQQCKNQLSVYVY